ncbi:organ specific protein [Tanacetum coccineum]
MLVRKGTLVSPLKSHCHTFEGTRTHEKSSNKEEFEPRPNISLYENDVNMKGTRSGEEFEPKPNISVYDNGVGSKAKRTSEKEFEPRPNISVYENGVSLQGKKASKEEFEPRPNISIYENDVSLKGTRTSEEEFEPRPNISIYENGANLKGTRTSEEEFEPRPNISVYENGVSLKGTKTSEKEFEPRPNISIYDNGVNLKGTRTSEEEFEPRPNISIYDNDSFQDCKIGQRRGLVDGNWKGMWAWRIPPRDIASLTTHIGNCTLSDGDDKWVWKGDASGNFKVSNLSVCIQNNLFTNTYLGLHHIWNSWIPRKVNLCVCRASINRLPTRLNLIMRGVILNSTSCPFYNTVEESIDHCLISCSIVVPIWRKVWAW